MPIYEYACPKCGVFDVMQKISDRALQKCPTCKSKVAKQMSSTAFQLKGSGWYITDYARKGGGGGSSKGEEKSASSGNGSDSSSTSESKGVDKKESSKETTKEAKPASSSSAD